MIQLSIAINCARMFCLLIVSNVDLVWNVFLVFSFFFIGRKLVNRPAHLLDSKLLLLFLFQLDTLLRRVVERLRLPQLIAYHVEVALHGIYQLSHFIFTDFLLCWAIDSSFNGLSLI